MSIQLEEALFRLQFNYGGDTATYTLLTGHWLFGYFKHKRVRLIFVFLFKVPLNEYDFSASKIYNIQSQVKYFIFIYLRTVIMVRIRCPLPFEYQ